tara:strand:+ start:314 stop:598 length:285 start_codon:yes stop_codon:yes gene_type:complete
MKIIKIVILTIFIGFLNFTYSIANECNKYDKLSKQYAKCESEKFKNKTSKKAEEIKLKTAKKIKEGKKKIKKWKLKDKFMKFKNSKSHKEFLEK